MPAKSKQQQKFFGVVKAMQKGDIPKTGEAGEVADDMTKKEVDKMASTKHKGLPNKIKEMIEEELQALNEVQPFVDNKLRNQWDYPLGNKDGLVYLATNDKRYPTEIVIYNQKRDVLHFVYSHDGRFTQGNTKTQTVPMKGFNSTHWVMPYFEEWEEDFDYERGFKESKLKEGAISPRDAKKLSIGDIVKTQKNTYKITGYGRRANAFRQFEVEDAKGKKYNIQVSLRGNSDILVAPGRSLNFREPGEMLEAKMTPAKLQKAQRELVATIDLLKKNFPMYKAAKESGDEKKLAKHRDIAIKLTKKKKQLEKALDAALGSLYQDAELELKEGILNEGKFRVGDIVIPNVGPHKGVKHTVIHDFRDGRYNIQPIGLRPNQIQYRLGAASANEDQLKKVSSGLQKVAPSIIDTSDMKPGQNPFGENKVNEALPKFKSPLEALKWVWAKRDEAMDMEQELKDISADIQQLHGEMEQEAEPGGGPIADKYGEELKALEDHHKQVRAEYNQLMAEIDEYDQNYM
jgi:hypothetical protein